MDSFRLFHALTEDLYCVDLVGSSQRIDGLMIEVQFYEDYVDKTKEISQFSGGPMHNFRFLGILLLFSASLLAYETPDYIKENYKRLYDTPVIFQEDGTRLFDRAQLLRRDNLYILSLEGDPFEMAFQHGRLLQKETAQGALPQLAKMLDNSVRNIFPSFPLVTDLIIAFLYRTETDGILNYGIQSTGGDRDRFLLEAYGLSEGSQIPLDDVIHAAFGPETLQVILGKQMSPSPIWSSDSPHEVLRNSCTDFAAKDGYTKNGGMIIGRNTDYPLNGYFDRFPTVIYFHPTDGSQNYLSLTTAGVHNAGVVGMNESGLFLGVHTIPTLEVSEKGTPTFMLGQGILKRAHSFDEAVNLFKKYKTAAGWAYTLISTEENRMGVIELTNDHVNLKETLTDLHVQTNHFTSKEMAHANLDLNASVNEDSRARRDRVAEMAKERLGFMTPQEAVNILSDKWDRVNKKISALGNTVAVHTTLSSMVFDSSTQKLYVASGLAPVSLSSYVELPSITTFDPKTFNSSSYEILENSTFYTDYPKLAEAEQLFIEAKTAYDSDLKPRRAFEILNNAIALVPDHSAFRFVHAIMALKSDLVEEAKQSLEECEGLSPLHYQLLGHYYLGRILAHEGQTEAAIAKLNLVIQKASQELEVPLLKATKKSLNQLKKTGRLKLNPATLAIFMPEADMLRY